MLYACDKLSSQANGQLLLGNHFRRRGFRSDGHIRLRKKKSPTTVKMLFVSSDGHRRRRCMIGSG